MIAKPGSLWIVYIVACLAALAVLGGCGAEQRVSQPIVVSHTDDLPSRLLQLAKIYEANGVVGRSAYTNEGETVLEVRGLRDPWEKLSGEAAEKLKRDVYAALGSTFDLRVVSYVLPEEADVYGRITALDGNRVLIVGDPTEDGRPDAMWVTFPSSVTDELHIGYRVKAWSSGMIDSSYPGQTGGVQLQVVDYKVGDGDLQGNITALNADDPDPNLRFVEIEGMKLRLLPYTRYEKDGSRSESGQLRVGQRVQAWTNGYAAGEDRFATQVNAVTEK